MVGSPARAVPSKITITVTPRTEKDVAVFEARCNNMNGLYVRVKRNFRSGLKPRK